MSGKNIVLEHKREFRRLMERIWSLYDRVPKEGKAKAQRLIDDWFNSKITYDQLVEELEKLIVGD
ncbi:MAG: hypothetical protein GSR85_01665 [Desulfurococcales archaeon]|nr:hypothetical protein [Desulfurococcales archaeon]